MSLVKSFSVGNGDMFYIKHGSDSFSIIDCCMSDDDREEIVKEIKKESADKGIMRVISSHPDDDHIRGLDYLDEQIHILNFYCVKNEATKDDETEAFKKYCELRDSDKAFNLFKGCSRKWMNKTDDERGSAGISMLWPDVSNETYKDALADAASGGSPNNISPIVQYSVNDGALMLWMGDLETDFMEAIRDELSLPHVDVLFAPHHGRDSGKIPKKLLDEMSPGLVVIGEAPADHLNYYSGYNTITQNSAGDIVFENADKHVHIFVSEQSYSVDFLSDQGISNKHGYYIGSLGTE